MKNTPTLKPHIATGVTRAPLPIRLTFYFAGFLFPDMVGQFVGEKIFRPRKRKHNFANNVQFGIAEKTTIPHDDYLLNLYAWGKGSRTILLVHGWEGNLEDMIPFVLPLVAQNFRVLALELPAHGDSESDETDVSDISEAIRRVVKSHEPIYAVVAHSIGSAAATHFVSENPGSVEKLVLIASGGDLENELERIAEALSLPGRCIARLKQYVSNRYGKPLNQCSTRIAARHVNIPALVIHDQHDRIVPFKEGISISESLPLGEYLQTSGLGHRKILRAPEVIDRVTSFCKLEPQLL